MSKAHTASQPTAAAATSLAKTCRTCLRSKPLDSFYRTGGTTRGRRAECKDCTLDRSMAERWAAAPSTPLDLERPDEALQAASVAVREARLDLGLAIAYATCEPGQLRTLEELAAFADVSPQAIRKIETDALRKVRERLRLYMLEAEIEESEVGA